MPITELILFACSVFFALNMGGAGFSPSFSTALGANLIRKSMALLLFGACVCLGAFVLGPNVAKTLGSGFVPKGTIDEVTVVVLVSSACGALFVANLAKIPESTSWVTVFAIASLGINRGNLNWDLIVYHLLPFWFAMPLVAFLLTVLFSSSLYPLRVWNYRIYEHLSKHEWKLRLLVIMSSCYLALAVGANNVANVVGPLASAGVFDIRTGMYVFAPLFTLGAIVFFKTTKTIGSDVVPIGLYSAMIVNGVVATLVLIMSYLGMPQSVVQAQVLAVFGIALKKEGVHELGRHPMIRRIGLFWVVSPLIAAGLVAAQLAIIE